MAKIKVLFLINSLGGGGAERVLVNLVNHIDHTLFDVTVQTIFMAGVNKDHLLDQVHLLEGKKKSFKGISKLIKILPKGAFNRYNRRIDSNHYDVVIAYLHGMATKILWNYKGKKIAWLHCDMKYSSLPIFFYKRQISKCFGTYDRIAGVSNTVCDSFQRLYGLGEKLVTVYNTNDTEAIVKQSSAEDYKRFGWNDFDGIKLVSLGRLAEQKGYDRLIAVCKKLKSDGLHFKLLILGKGEQERFLHEMIMKNGLENDVELGGFFVNPYPYVKQADLFVSSSRYEGLSTVMSETLILGTPIISTDVSGVREVLGENSEFGLIVENSEKGLYDGLKELLSTPEKIEHYRKKSLERAPIFNTKTTVRMVENLIEEVLNE